MSSVQMRSVAHSTDTIMELVVEREECNEVLKVAGTSRPTALAGAVAGVIRSKGVVELQSIGAGATNQAIKAIAIARSYLRSEGIDLIFTPSFIDIAAGEAERTAIRLLVEKR